MAMLRFDPLKVLGQGFFHGQRKHGVAVLVPLAGSDHDLISSEVDILHSETATLHETKTGAVEQCRHKPGCSIELTQQGFHFFARQDHWQPVRPFGAHHTMYVADVLAKDLMVEEQHRV